MKHTLGKKQGDQQGCARKENLFWNIVLSSERRKWGKMERVFYGKNDFLRLNNNKNKLSKELQGYLLIWDFFFGLLHVILYQEETYFQFYCPGKKFLCIFDDNITNICTSNRIRLITHTSQISFIFLFPSAPLPSPVFLYLLFA